MTTGRINQVTWWRNRCGRRPTETYREDYKTCSRCNQKIASQHFFANPQNETCQWIDARRHEHQHETLLRLMTMTNSRCRSTDLALNRFVTRTKCDSTNGLPEARSSQMSWRPPDCSNSASPVEDDDRSHAISSRCQD